MLITPMFSVVAKKSRTFPSLPCSLMSRVQELGGSTARQPAQAGQRTYSAPWTACSAYEWGLSGGQGAPSLCHAFESGLSWKFEFFWQFSLFGSFVIFAKFTSSRFRDRCSRTGCESVNQVVRKLYCV